MRHKAKLNLFRGLWRRALNWLDGGEKADWLATAMFTLCCLYVVSLDGSWGELNVTRWSSKYRGIRTSRAAGVHMTWQMAHPPTENTDFSSGCLDTPFTSPWVYSQRLTIMICMKSTGIVISDVMLCLRAVVSHSFDLGTAIQEAHFRDAICLIWHLLLCSSNVINICRRHHIPPQWINLQEQWACHCLGERKGCCVWIHRLRCQR